MADDSNVGAEDFKLERYKFILQQQNALNEHTHKYLTFFQTVITAIIGASVLIFLASKEGKIDSDTARIAFRGVEVLAFMVAVFLISTVIAGIFSWFDYRNEEVELLEEAVRPEFRKSPEWKNLLRWYEFYAVVFFIVVTLSLILYIELGVIPSLK